MSLKSTNKLENSTIELVMNIDKESFDKAVTDAFRKNAPKMTLPGFRKGKAPRPIIEKMYGKGVFYDEAINSVLPGVFESAVSEAGLEPIDRPAFEVLSIDETGVEVKAVFPVKPEVEIKQYKGLEAERTVLPTTDEQVNAEIERIRNRNARTIDITDRPAANGDIVVIDYNGSVDGVEFEGGKAEKHELKLGSGQFIPGFEEQVIGHSVGDAFDVNVTFPEDYHSKELAGKAAVFKVVLNGIKFNELPALDDDFAKDVSESDTFDEYKASVAATITKRHEADADNEVEEKLTGLLIDNLNAAIPEVMFRNETEQQIHDYDNRLQMQGLSLDTYLKYTGMDIDKLRAQFRPMAERQVKARLALEKIAELESIAASEDEIEEEYKKVADSYNIDIEKVKAQLSSELVSGDIKLRKAADFVKTNAVITEKKAEAAE